MKLGGKVLTVHTGPDGTAKLVLPELDGIASIYAPYQMVTKLKLDHQYPDFKAAQLPQLENHANNGLDP